MKRELCWILVCACAASNDAAPSGVTNTEREQQTERGSEAAGNDANSGAGGSGSMQSSSDSEGRGVSDRSDQALGGAADSAMGDDGASGEGGTLGDAGTTGAGGATGEGGTTGEGGAAMQPDSPCPTPAGEDVTAIAYEPPAITAGCNLQMQPFQGDRFTTSVNVQSEAEFLEAFACPAGAASGIDFETQLLRVSVVREAGFANPTLLYAREAGGTLQLGFSVPRYCGGPFPPTALAFTLLPAGTGAVEDDVCRPGDCGAGGFPP